MPDMFLFVEGPDDDRLFRRVLRSRFESLPDVDAVHIIPYAEQPVRTVTKLINSCIALGDPYLFFSDLDKYPCVTACRDHALETYESLSEDRVRIVSLEIESWYAATMADSEIVD